MSTENIIALAVAAFLSFVLGKRKDRKRKKKEKDVVDVDCKEKDD